MGWLLLLQLTVLHFWKSVRNRCVIEVFGGFVVLARSFFDFFFCGCRGFCHRTESDLFLFCYSNRLLIFFLLADTFLYSYEAGFIQSLLSTGKKQLASRFILTYRSINDVLSKNIPEFEIYLSQMYPAKLEIKDTTESITSASYLDLVLSIGRDGQLHTLPFTTNEMISISTSQTFRSWVVIFHLRRPMAFLSLSLYDTPGTALCMNVLFWGLGDSPVSYSNRDTSWNALNHHSGSFMIDTEILFINMRSPSHECLMTFWSLTSYSDFPTDQTFHQIHFLDTELDLHRITSVFYGAFATGVACQQGTLTLSDT